ncbi:hypothetical protein CVS30_12585 [Arthrobacter psychrolactophilus]|uniref:HTH luxR-type domain-containing protein n=1 Tax=Arthrobacter psychrolactophilus TaxID=92442 RepID=A0A2V5J655_9MICC|nr:LuxR C-terminal-related transcriptional regulator [Arthrobacter psychrolactophilus]PYI38050.1 hypothetical protein CVS30_12585 [Arthrobacter psychrolactophilus]
MGEQELTFKEQLPWFLVSPPQPGNANKVRIRLNALLDDVVCRYPITLLAAPSGYAKTATLSAWSRESQSRVAWLTLIWEVCESEASLLSGLLSALHRLTPQLSENEAASLARVHLNSTGTQQTLEQLATFLVELQEPIVVVIDDAQLAGSALAEGFVRTLSHHCHGRLRFVLAGTPELNQHFNRLLAEGTAGYLGPADLAMTSHEIAKDYEEAHLPLSEGGAAQILQDTGGWPIAVQLALLSAHPDRGGAAPIAGAVLTEFVATSILGRLRPELADFILAATTCVRLDSRLVTLVTGAANGEALLEECASHGIFLDRFPDEHRRTVYQWQTQFAQQCQLLMSRNDAQRWRRLHSVAASGLAGHYPSEAITHALLADDHDQALEILRNSWLRVMIDSGAGLLHGLALQVAEREEVNAEVLLIRACCLDMLGDVAGSLMLYAQARGLVSTMDSVDPGLRSTMVFAELFLANEAQALAAAVDEARATMETSSRDAVSNAAQQFFLGWTELRLRRNPAAAVRLLRSALRQAEDAGLQNLARRVRVNLMFALSYGGYFSAARAVMDEAHGSGTEIGEWNRYDGGIECFARGFTDYWQGRLPEAKQAFSDMVDGGGHQASYTALARLYLVLCTVGIGDAREIRIAETLIEGISQSEQHGVPWHIYRTLATASLRAATGDAVGASDLMGGFRAVENIPVVLITAAEIHRKAGRTSEAMALLGGIAAPGMVSYVATGALVTSALISLERGERDEAHRKLEQALDIAAKESIVRPFMEADDALVRFMTEHAAWGTAHEEFLAARISHGNLGVSRQEILGSQLSTRELEVFGFLCTTKTADEIAAALFVSVNTVRTHQRSIYRKLGVSTRREAIRHRV